MCDGFFYGCMLFFSAYGIFSLVFFLRAFFLEKKYLRGKCIYTLIRVSEEDLYAEEMVRALLFCNYKNDTGICEHKIIAVTNDETACNARRIRKFFEKDSEVFVCGEGALSNCFQKG